MSSFSLYSNLWWRSKALSHIIVVTARRVRREGTFIVAKPTKYLEIPIDSTRHMIIGDSVEADCSSTSEGIAVWIP